MFIIASFQLNIILGKNRGLPLFLPALFPPSCPLLSLQNLQARASEVSGPIK